MTNQWTTRTIESRGVPDTMFSFVLITNFVSIALIAGNVQPKSSTLKSTSRKRMMPEEIEKGGPT